MSLGVVQNHIEPNAVSGVEFERAALIRGQHDFVEIHIADVHIRRAMIRGMRQFKFQRIGTFLFSADILRGHALRKGKNAAIKGVAHFRRIIRCFIKGEKLA